MLALGQCKLLEVVLESAIWRIFGLRKHDSARDVDGSEMGLVVVSMDLLEGAVLVTEVAPFSVLAELLPVELPAVLRLIFVV